MQTKLSFNIKSDDHTVSGDTITLPAKPSVGDTLRIRFATFVVDEVIFDAFCDHIGLRITRKS